MKAEVGETVTRLRAEVEALRPARDAAAAAVPAKAREAFERLAEHHEGEAISAISKPDRPQREEYLCTACNMELARDVYNSCTAGTNWSTARVARRILYIPDDLSVEEARGRPSRPSSGPGRRRRGRRRRRPGAAAPAAAAAAADASAAGNGSDVVEIELRAKGKLGEGCPGRGNGPNAIKAGETPVECEVFVGDKLAGIYKGQSAEQLERAARYYLGEAKIEGDVRAVPVAEPEPERRSRRAARQ